MRFRFLFLITGLAVLLSACSGSEPQIPPSKDKLTFLFFYTDGWNPWANMEPVVNGLEAKFDAQVEFQRINAGDSDGRVIFQSYGLRGHPAYIILNPQGDVLWQGLGELSLESMQAEILKADGNK